MLSGVSYENRCGRTLLNYQINSSVHALLRSASSEAARDQTSPDLAPPDLAPPGLASPGLAPPDLAQPGVAPPELAPPELAPNRTEKAIEAFIKAAAKPRLRFEALVIPPDGRSYFGRKADR